MQSRILPTMRSVETSTYRPYPARNLRALNSVPSWESSWSGWDSIACLKVSRAIKATWEEPLRSKRTSKATELIKEFYKAWRSKTTGGSRSKKARALRRGLGCLQCAEGAAETPDPLHVPPQAMVCQGGGHTRECRQRPNCMSAEASSQEPRLDVDA